jgi:hypothetical protein
MQTERLTLANLKGGAALEMVDLELERIAENCLDVNTDAGAKRVLTLRIEFRPDKTRESMKITFKTATQLPSVDGGQALAYFGKEGGKPVIYEYNPRQLELDDIAPSGKTVVNIGRPAEGGAR